MRIVSLVPSWTEYLVDLGLEDQLVGRTKFCVRAGPHSMRIPRIGGTKTLHLDRIASLKPDLIIASKEENVREQVEACTEFSDVFLTDVRDVHGAFDALEAVAERAGRKAAGKEWRAKTEEAWGKPRPVFERAYYVIWQKPLMVAGQDTYIHSVMRWWGIENAECRDSTARYPALRLDREEPLACRNLLLSSEPFPFNATHCEAWAEEGFQARCVDGEAFSWYGSRMFHSVEYLRNIALAV